MSDFVEDFKAHLQADSSITAVVSARIYPQIIPDRGNIPAITYRIISGEPANSLDGHTNGLVHYILQVDCWTRSFETAKNLARLVRNRIATKATTFSALVLEVPGEDEYEDDTKRYRRMLTLSCRHHEN
jgi:hypothetical protein